LRANYFFPRSLEAI